jgi:hypothetical protein
VKKILLNMSYHSILDPDRNSTDSRLNLSSVSASDLKNSNYHEPDSLGNDYQPAYQLPPQYPISSHYQYQSRPAAENDQMSHSQGTTSHSVSFMSPQPRQYNHHQLILKIVIAIVVITISIVGFVILAMD